MTSNWIPITERLPTPNESIIIYGCATCNTCDPAPTVREGCYKPKTSYRSAGFEFGVYDCGCAVTHWMPMPAAPEGK